MSNADNFKMNDPLFHFYSKKDVEYFRGLVDKERVFAQKFIDEQTTKGISPELVGVLSGLGTGAIAAGLAIPTAIGTAATTATAGLAGLSAAGVTGTLAAAGGGAVAAGGAGVAGGVGAIAGGAAATAIGTAAIAVALPAVLIGGTAWGVINQAKLKKNMTELIRLSFEYEEILKLDRREEVIDLLSYVRVARQGYIK